MPQIEPVKNQNIKRPIQCGKWGNSVEKFYRSEKMSGNMNIQRSGFR